MHAFDVKTLTAGRWHNGGGATREIASHPAGAGVFEWRASLADIDRSGPFSVFPGVDRTLTLVAGDGMRLSSPGLRTPLVARTGEPLAFSGDLAVDADLPDGACRALNVMVRRGRWTARVQQVTAPVAPPPGHAGVLHVLRGRWRTGDGTSVLAPGQGLWWHADEKAPNHAAAPLSADATALWADLAPSGSARPAGG
ncbi:HutD family protein [Streptomyces sp. NPDC058872]|uniref:HutD/Ves family protein n=1 Tax=Streptomyces sp. NPDC058872 TaxID=3346661 RepID=UPI0036C8379B